MGLVDLGLKVRIKASIDISLGLVVTLLGAAFGTAFADIKEIIMNNVSAFTACVWCGVAFLRSPAGFKLQPEREMYVGGGVRASQERTQEG